MIYKNIQMAYIVKYFAENNVKMNNDLIFTKDEHVFNKILLRMATKYLKEIINPEHEVAAFFYRTGGGFLKVTLRKRLRYGMSVRYLADLLVNKIDLYSYALVNNFRSYTMDRLLSVPHIDREHTREVTDIFNTYQIRFRDTISNYTLTSGNYLLMLNMMTIHNNVQRKHPSEQYERFIEQMDLIKEYAEVMRKLERETL